MYHNEVGSARWITHRADHREPCAPNILVGRLGEGIACALSCRMPCILGWVSVWVGGAYAMPATHGVVVARWIVFASSVEGWGQPWVADR